MSIQSDYPFKPVPFTSVTFTDNFWLPRIETNRSVTLPYNFRKCEETGRIDNFAKAAGQMEGPHEGIFFNDSDVFKVVEGAAYSLASSPDPDMDVYLDNLIALFAGAQEADGYLYTARTIDPTAVTADREGLTRWSHLRVNHELYNVGHLYEAAAAHFQATGRRNLLDVALKNADLIDSVFGPETAARAFQAVATMVQEMLPGITFLGRFSDQSSPVTLRQRSPVLRTRTSTAA